MNLIRTFLVAGTRGYRNANRNSCAR
jgi:hypothetical protein